MFDFDEIIDRNNTNAISVEGYQDYLFASNSGLKLNEGSGIVRMWIADMDFATPDFVLDAIKKRLDRKILGYSKIFDQEYYEAFNSWLARQYDWQVDSAHVLPSLGIIPALNDLVGLLTNEDEKVLILTPSYGYFEKAVEQSNRKLVCSNLINNDGHFAINYEEIEDIVKDEKVSMCIFCHPHNPTGRLWKEEELTRLGNILIERNIWIVSDEIHCDLLRRGKRHQPLAKHFPDYTRVITCMSCSKTFNMAGMMLANIIIPDDQARTLWLQKNQGMVNPLAIAGVKAAYEHGVQYLNCLQSYLDENFAFLDDYLATHLPLAKFQIPEATYLAWIDLNDYLDDAQKDVIGLDIATKAGVIVEGGDMFVQNGKGFIRLNIAVPKPVLAIGLDWLCRYLNGSLERRV